jgi:type IV secretion system protein VirB1
MDLLSVVLACSPLVDPAMTLRVIAVESAGHIYAIHDNTDGRSYDGANEAQAVRFATTLIRAGHRVDLGLMQINYEAWLRPTQFALRSAFDPCTNIRLGTTILSANYARALQRSTTESAALWRALSAYNSGSESRSLHYAQQVLGARSAHPPRHGF